MKISKWKCLSEILVENIETNFDDYKLIFRIDPMIKIEIFDEDQI